MPANKRGENRFGPLRLRYPLSPALHRHPLGMARLQCCDLATSIFPLLIERVSSALSKLLRSIVAWRLSILFHASPRKPAITCCRAGGSETAHASMRHTGTPARRHECSL